MIRIALIAHLDEISGGGVALLEVAKGLDGNRFETVLVLPGEGALTQRAKERGLAVKVIANPQVSISQTRLIRRITVAVKRLWYVGRLTAFLRRQKFDLVYINTTATVFPEIAARLAGRRMVCHVHETHAPESGFDRGRKASIIRRCCRGLLYASESARKGFPPPGGMPNLVVKNFVDIDALENASANTGKGEGFLIIGNGLFPRKGNDVLLRSLTLAIPRLPTLDLKVHIVGNSQIEHLSFETALHELAKGSILKGKVEFTGAVESLAKEMAGANLFVSAGRNEALPISIVEAMALGIPVIATDVGDCARLLGGGQCGWIVQSDNPGAMAQAIIEVALNPRLAAQRAAAGKNKVLVEYAVSNFWLPLENWLCEIAEDKKRY